MTTVVNIFKDRYDTYIGRAGKGHNGYFGNEHPIGFCKICNKTHDRDGAIDAFEKDFDARIEKDEEYRRRVLELKDKALGCFCKQRGNEVRCHGDVIANYLDNLSTL